MKGPQRVSIGAIERAASVASCLDESDVEQDLQMLGDGRLAEPERHSDVADGALFRAEVLENLPAARFGDCVERVGCRRGARHGSDHIPIWEYVKLVRTGPALDFAWRRESPGRVQLEVQ